MNLIILGPQGSGKGTQAELLARKFNWEHIDMGKTLREIAKLDTPLGKKVYSIQNVTKTLVPDEVLEKILRLELSSLGREQGIVIDGAPRNLAQAKYLNEELLQEFGRKIDRVFFVEISPEESVKRISKRWNCKKCAAILIMGKDIKSEKDDCPKCGGEIGQRKDDTEEGVRKRLAIFEAETIPVIEYFREVGLLEEINGEQTVEKVFQDVLENLKSLE